MISAERIWESTTLPTLPVVAMQLIDLSKDPEVDLREVVDVIKTDPAIAARILKAVNSSYFGLRSEVKSLDKAIPILGTTVLTSLALSFSLAPDSVKGGGVDEHYSEVWLQSITHAAVCELLAAEKCTVGIPSEYFLGGLFAEIGRLAMLRAIPNEYRAVVDHVHSTGAEVSAVERELLGFDHVDIGYKLLSEWQLPESMCEAVSCHELGVDEISEYDSAPAFDLIRAVRVAALIGRYFHSSEDVHGEALTDLREGWTTLFAGDEIQLDRLLVKARARIEEAGQMLRIDTSSLPEVAELTAQANLQLAELAMRGHAETAQVAARNEELETERQRLAETNKQLAVKATRDPLTGLYNREYFVEAGRQMVSRAARAGERFGVIFMDMDRFKNLNDTYGHPFGDEVLRGVAKIMRDGMRRSDVVARYGGEEIVVLAEKIAMEELSMITDRLREEIELADFVTAGQRVEVTASFGVCLAEAPFAPADSTLDEVIALADQAMYTSKTNGRNQVTYLSYSGPSEPAVTT